MADAQTIPTESKAAPRKGFAAPALLYGLVLPGVLGPAGSDQEETRHEQDHVASYADCSQDSRARVVDYGELAGGG